MERVNFLSDCTLCADDREPRDNLDTFFEPHSMLPITTTMWKPSIDPVWFLDVPSLGSSKPTFDLPLIRLWQQAFAKIENCVRYLSCDPCEDCTNCSAVEECVCR